MAWDRKRPAFVFTLLLAFFAALILATPAGAQLVTAPAQVRHADPPPPEMSASQLEIRGDELRGEKLFADSIDYYEAALKRKAPDPSSLHNKIGIALLQMLRFDAARKSFDRALKYDKNSAEAWNNLGVSWYSKKKYGSAIKAYEKALAIKADSASFHSNLGTAFFAKKEYERANNEYLQALQLDPDIFDRRSTTGIALHMTSLEDRARFSYVIARTFAKRGDVDRSLLYLRKAMEDGYPHIENVYKEDEFAGLRKDPRFAELMARKPTSIPQD
jgi:tetratricopeptide (TPR) repeat protein